MAGKGPPPGDIKSYRLAEGPHFDGDIPEPPEGLMPASVVAWNTWFRAWYSWFWTPDDVPALRQLILLYDQFERGEHRLATEIRLQSEVWGITPKGQLANRWAPMGATEPVKLDASSDQVAAQRAKRDRKLA